MSVSPSVIPGKLVRSLMRFRGSGGSALPGLIIEKIDPRFVRRTLANLPLGIVLISGTNGKTTTTKMVVELLRGQGLKVFTNRSGSNFTRGIASELIGATSILGRLDADIAVLELDEAYAVHFVRMVKPRYSLLLNVLRDQLDRFGEIDYTASLLEKVATATTEKVLINREDPRLRAIGAALPAEKVAYYGLADKLLEHFPSDEELHAVKTLDAAPKRPPAMAVLNAIDSNTASFTIGKGKFETSLKLSGIYNIYNATGALGLVDVIRGEKLNSKKMLRTLATIKPAFGRGEILTIGKHPLEIVLVKNPSGFQLGLESYPSEGYATMLAINDSYADGRDVSWLYDVDFSSLTNGVSMVSGIRAYDMALRLNYDNIESAAVSTDITLALKKFIDIDAPKRIFCTYTAMLKIRSELAKYTKVEKGL